MRAYSLIAIGLISTLSLCVAIGQEQSPTWTGTTRSVHSRGMRTPNIEQKLDLPFDANLVDIPLKSTFDYLSEATGIPFSFDKKAVSEDGISVETTVTIQLQGASLRTVIRLILEPMLLTTVTEGGVLKITTQQVARKKLYSRSYSMQDLLAADTQHAAEADDRPLFRAIQISTSEKWEELDGEGGTMTRDPDGESLHIRQTQKAHREITGLLAALRKARRDNQQHSLKSE